MDEANNSVENISKERVINKTLDLAPIEHILFSSSTEVNNQFINLNELQNSLQLQGDLTLLLTPTGLTNKKAEINEVRARREKQKTLSGWFACFIAPADVLLGGYEFDYVLGGMDASGKIPNKFEFQLTNVHHERFFSNKDGRRALEEIELSEGFLPKSQEQASIFTLSKNLDTGILTVIFVSLQNKA